MKNYFLVIVVIFTALLFVSCGRNSDNGNNAIEQTGNPVVVGTNEADIEVETLTIFTNMWSESRFRDSARSFSEHMALQGRIVEVNIVTYMHEETDMYMENLLGQLDIGIGPDIISRDSLFLYRLIENGFLLDIREIISQYGVTDDFMMNVLEHSQVNGRTYVFPTDVNLQFVGINENLPQRFINRFESLEVITMIDLIDIYLELVEDFPEYEEFAFMFGGNMSQPILNEVAARVDFAGRTADLSDLEEYINNVMRVFEINMARSSNWGEETDETMAERAEQYVFMSAHQVESALFEFQNPFFVHFSPMADNDGNLIPNWSQAELSITTNANVELAWAFVEHLITQMFTGQNWSVRMPIARRYLQQSVEQAVNNSLQWRDERNRPLAGSPESMVDITLRRLETYSYFPIKIPLTNYLIPWNALGDGIGRIFMPEHEEDTNISEWLLLMEESLVAWLNEEREIIPYVPAPPVEDLGLPARVLTIHGARDFDHIIAQAVAAMNASWREADKPYVFDVDFDYFESNNWEGMQARETRLRTDLMAGSGPDFMFLEANNLQSTFDFARSGFFANFYELIDNDARFSRDDFFTNVLDEFEMLGMLPILPLGFAFHYIGINAGLPQQLIDEFENLPYLSRIKLVEMYLNFRANDTDFDHLEHGLPWTMTSFWSIFNHIAPRYVNLATRTSYLNTHEFIEMLNELNDLFADDPFGGGGGSTIHLPITPVDFWRDRANDAMFLEHEMALNPTHAFISVDNPPFVHYRPISNEDGRLSFALDGGGMRDNNWASIAIVNGNNVDLAWEFVYYLMDAFANPVGRATTMPGWGSPAPWGVGALITPIRRDLAETHVRRTFEHVLGTHARAFGFTEQDELNFPNMAEEAAARLLEYSNMPVSLSANLFPMMMLNEHLSEFMMGMITADVAAQRMHNMMSLWLIE